MCPIMKMAFMVFYAKHHKFRDDLWGTSIAELRDKSIIYQFQTYCKIYSCLGAFQLVPEDRTQNVTMHKSNGPYVQELGAKMRVHGQGVHGHPIHRYPIHGHPIHGHPSHGHPIHGHPIHGDPIHGHPDRSLDIKFAKTWLTFLLFSEVNYINY